MMATPTGIVPPTHAVIWTCWEGAVDLDHLDAQSIASRSAAMPALMTP
jgi:hypothetical protein